MIDREKVMQALYDSLKNQHCGFVDGVGDVYAVSEETIRNVIALLKEHESIIESLKSDLHETLEVVSGRLNVVRCNNCKYCIKEPNGELYCDILAIGYEPLGSKKVNADWFCADGERKDEVNE